MPPAPTLRHLQSNADYAACLELQRDTWGRDFAESVPPSILRISQRLGGVAAGAFDDAGRLVGFVYGMTGVEGGRLVHWSDMLAVRPEARGHGLAGRLKAFQRDAVRALAVVAVRWSFDPLVARNAHLNLVSLGARLDEYVHDMYGTTGSALHGSVPTDRGIAEWPTDDALVEAQREAARHALADKAWESVPDLATGDGTGEGGGADAMRRARIGVPAEWETLVRDAPRALEWRMRTRDAFDRARGAGFRVVSFALAPAGSDRGGHYLLERA